MRGIFQGELLTLLLFCHCYNFTFSDIEEKNLGYQTAKKAN